jgi:hypothetical protein
VAPGTNQRSKGARLSASTPPDGNATIVRACLAGIEAFERVLAEDEGRALDPGHRLEASVEVDGSDLIVRSARGEARGRLSGLWLLAARVTDPSNLRIPTGANDARPQYLNREVCGPLFEAGLAYAAAGAEDEALFCLRRATHGCADDAELWRNLPTRVPEELLRKAPKKLLNRAAGATRLERATEDFDGSVAGFARTVAAFASDRDPLLRHDCAAGLARAARES